MRQTQRYYGAAYTYNGELTTNPDWLLGENDYGVTVAEAKAEAMKRPEVWGIALRSASPYGPQRSYLYAKTCWHGKVTGIKPSDFLWFYASVRQLRSEASHRAYQDRIAAENEAARQAQLEGTLIHGTLDGDGSDFGFWPDGNYAEDAEEGPEPGDYLLSDTGPLGSRTMLTEHEGGFIGEYATREEAEEVIRARMEAEQFYPNVWVISDHGNIHGPISID